MSDEVFINKNEPTTPPVEQESVTASVITDSDITQDEDFIHEVGPTDSEIFVEEPVTEQPVVEKTIGRKQQQVIVEYDINANEKLTSGERLNLPSHFDKETSEAIQNLPNINLVDNPDTRKWATILNEGLQFNTMNEVGVDALEDPSAEFKQSIEFNGNRLAAASPKMKAIENQNLKGERANIRLLSHLGLGTIFQVPLWHSGFWITFKPPTESEIVEFNRLFVSDKISFGRQTYGLAFSNTVSYTTDRVLEFALSHVYDTTIKSEDVSLDNIKQHISTQDIHNVIWGFVCTMYPRGFMYSRACVADPEKCNHIVEDTINVAKLQWTNNMALTDWQKTHMSHRQPRSRDLISVTRYKEELAKIQKTKKVINEGMSSAITITIKTPSVIEYIDSGHKWIGDIVDSVEKIVGTTATKNEKDVLITRHAQATSIRQYSHWIESIEIESNIIDDKETIETALESLSGDDLIRDQIIKAVVNYINSSIVSVIGIPVYDCPACGKVQSSTLENLNSNFKNILPLDVIQVFFDLITQRIQRLAER